jgi:hypothetical protein
MNTIAFLHVSASIYSHPQGVSILKRRIQRHYTTLTAVNGKIYNVSMLFKRLCIVLC